MKKYAFFPNSKTKKLLGLQQDKYVDSDFTSLMKQVLGERFGELAVSQTLRFKLKFNQMLAQAFVLKNPKEINNLEKMFQLSSIGIVQLSDKV